MPISTIGTASISGLGYGFKNRIINGAMMIDQRNAGASVSASNANPTFAVDRFSFSASQNAKLTLQQNANSITPPTGFAKYWGATVGASANVTVGATDYFGLQHRIEGNNLTDMGFGAAGASTFTVSFWVRSSLTGTFGLALQNGGQTRSYATTYTINSANTWEYKTITIAGDTSGTWATDNTAGLVLTWGLGIGSTYSIAAGTSWSTTSSPNGFGVSSTVQLVQTNSATFYITGVQLEKGSTATSFDYRPYGTELALCQRYYHKLTGASGASGYQGICVGQVGGSTSANLMIKLPVSMRATPTTGYGGTVTIYDTGAAPSITSIGTTYLGNDTLFVAVNASGGGLTTARCCSVYTGNASTNYMDFSSEL